MFEFSRRALVGATATAALMVAGAGIASAHVTVVAPGAEQGGYTVLTFRVPTESETAGTTALTVELPGLRSARTEPLPGWTATVEKDPESQLATSVTWTAEPDVQVGPGQFQQFVLSVGPLPEEDEVAFPAIQTYSDGEVVAWDEITTGDEEPERPAPSLTLAASSGDGHGGSGDAHATETEQTAGASEDTTDSTARWLGGIGLVLGALGAALGLGAVIRGRRA
ncbi:YcnI family protein [Rhodococcus pyridinivorans]|uniref:Nuclear export factor GLE1 n=2 Tax=Rhodococcus pyridinivorans TaxID=103816 RepID=V9XJS0_9NOCA|nr:MULTISPECIES: YcnI family protein [Rhodococcus]AHD22230.1 nuclear export factor GLE1 [Rhodococcus pyridinivorans SB3094]MCT7291546.1 YcnI family protein [Rhodococcus sp. PAE-6]OBA30316.1 nuclear export factor GLE1 [Rhodococcus sp. 852002-51564_SCH6189132-a]QOV98976.1 YcnI family protein [Rhodococcus pyridinivorans]UTM37406.1 YcnI family protein [Rhodococcus pyridinivorans]